MKKWILALLVIAPAMEAGSNESERFWMKIKAANAIERSAVANVGVAIEGVREDYVFGIGTADELHRLQKAGKVEAFYQVTEQAIPRVQDFPNQDADYHNYTEVKDALSNLAQEFPDVIQEFTLGTSIEGRAIKGIRISTDLPNAHNKPGIFFVGGHHAREHLSVEMALRFAQNFMQAYKNGDARITRLIQTRDIHIVPALNADGLEFDVASGRYQSWRKNRAVNSDRSYGVDLNRNYGYQWGTGGSSSSPRSETYMGPRPFSEPETIAVRDYLTARRNITTVLSFHTFSELILYPWGHKDGPIENQQDRLVHETMARKMAEWNGYTPQKTSELYIASGDLTDWAYGELKMFSFTFELDPQNMWGGGGFYPGAGVIPGVVQKNTEPCLYLMEYADNPYRVLQAGNRYHPY